MGERIVDSTEYRGYRISIDPERKGGRYLDMYAVSIHRPSAPELQLSTIRGFDMNEAQAFDTEKEARESALAKAREWIDERERAGS